jgi:hypothetical protein
LRDIATGIAALIAPLTAFNAWFYSREMHNTTEGAMRRLVTVCASTQDLRR